jgi:hypothetical protein
VRRAPELIDRFRREEVVPMKWFGIHRADPEEEVVSTPVGKPCAFCEEAIEMGDRGVTVPHIDERGVVEKPYHFECHMRLVIGSVGHLQAAVLLLRRQRGRPARDDAAAGCSRGVPSLAGDRQEARWNQQLAPTI